MVGEIHEETFILWEIQIHNSFALRFTEKGRRMPLECAILGVCIHQAAAVGASSRTRKLTRMQTRVVVSRALPCARLRESFRSSYFRSGT